MPGEVADRSGCWPYGGWVVISKLWEKGDCKNVNQVADSNVEVWQ